MSVMNYWGAKTSFTDPTSPSVFEMVQNILFLFGKCMRLNDWKRIFSFKNCSPLLREKVKKKHFYINIIRATECICDVILS